MRSHAVVSKDKKPIRLEARHHGNTRSETRGAGSVEAFPEFCPKFCDHRGVDLDSIP